MRTPSASIIIPAHNEEKVISDTLRVLLRDAALNEFEVVVTCNGCTDRTASIAREYSPHVRVIENSVASKTIALNSADEIATVFPRVYLDADIRVDADFIRKLTQPLTNSNVVATCVSMRANTRHSSFLVRSYYRAWLLNPYFCKGKLGGVFALSQQGKALVGEIPCITNDDEYVRRKVPESQTCFIEDCEFEVIAPISISSLINVRTRVMRGNQELRAAGLNVKERQVETSWMLKQIVSNPSSIPDLIVYSAVNLWVKSKLLFQFGDHPRWERDESSRDHMATEVYQ